MSSFNTNPKIDKLILYLGRILSHYLGIYANKELMKWFVEEGMIRKVDDILNILPVEDWILNPRNITSVSI